MKFRIIIKKLKKDVLLNLWIKSLKDWEIAIDDISHRYTYPGGVYMKYYMDSSSYAVSCSMLRFDWQKILKRGEQLGFRHKIIKKYFNEIK